MRRSSNRGVPFVLTADPTLTANYASLFDAMAATSQTTLVPWAVLRSLAPPPPKSTPLDRTPMPLGLRRFAAALLQSGVPADECIVAPFARLGEVIGPATRLVAISTGDPLGIAMNSTTMTEIVPGRIWTAVGFERTLARVQVLTRGRASVLVGGPGAWQFTPDHRWLRSGRITMVVNGMCEANAGALFQQCLDASPGDPGVIVSGAAPAADDVPPIRGPTTAGCIEVTRGCGLGCKFCVLRHTPMCSLPPDLILHDAAIVAEAGRTRTISLVGEDILRYGGDGVHPNLPALLSLLYRIRETAPDALLQADHVNLCSAARLSDEDLCEVRNCLAVPGQEFVWVNVGVETVNGELLAAAGGRAKMGEASPDEWADFAAEQVRRLLQAGFFPLVSLVLGLPGETADDIEAARRWVAEFANERLAVFPLFYAPPAPPGQGEGRPVPTRAHWRLLADCYRLNFRYVPRLIAEHQRLGGASFLRRSAVQSTGKLQVLLWKTLLRLRALAAR